MRRHGPALDDSRLGEHEYAGANRGDQFRGAGAIPHPLQRFRLQQLLTDDATRNDEDIDRRMFVNRMVGSNAKARPRANRRQGRGYGEYVERLGLLRPSPLADAAGVCNSMPSRIDFITSRRVSATATQPGKSGTYAP